MIGSERTEGHPQCAVPLECEPDTRLTLPSSTNAAHAELKRGILLLYLAGVDGLITNKTFVRLDPDEPEPRPLPSRDDEYPWEPYWKHTYHIPVKLASSSRSLASRESLTQRSDVTAGDYSGADEFDKHLDSVTAEILKLGEKRDDAVPKNLGFDSVPLESPTSEPELALFDYSPIPDPQLDPVWDPDETLPVVNRSRGKRRVVRPKRWEEVTEAPRKRRRARSSPSSSSSPAADVPVAATDSLIGPLDSLIGSTYSAFPPLDFLLPGVSVSDSFDVSLFQPDSSGLLKQQVMELLSECNEDQWLSLVDQLSAAQ
ncbi:MAG: hypothetical protein KVP17_002592 [Porospora cf. gigantea B]|uniref:uncharacterized protein n=1 Tax=Porospora cf. gigantea B TaxID=2853592 RepID=UPI0035717C36|nr:MAG: hypothetical protein KVP17_002592 [Porospora cf. gigantea B]